MAAFFLGAWLLGSLSMFFVATQNFQGVERVLDAPSAKATPSLRLLGHEEARFLLRYQVSELNRFYFSVWERVQLVLGAGLTLLAWRWPWRKKIVLVPAILLLIVAATHWFMTPEITRLGRLMDFVPNARETATGQTFWRYHQIYSTLEVFKFLLGLYLAFTLLVRSRASEILTNGRVREVDVVHNS
ncbi:MAG: hypothetical protein IT169_19085 [Bryobacterales bacterium]|nr:hypothetical protein [Bryobacterales bacterium]